MDTHAQTTSLEQLRKQLGAATLDVCDQCQVINITLRELEGEHDAGFALLRSIKSFNDQIFQKLAAIDEALSRQKQEGGVQ